MIVLLFIYDLLFLLGLIVYLPRALKRKRITFASLREKFSCTRFITKNESIWIQVVSVGEVNVIAGLLEYLRSNFAHDIVISTTTLTGQRLAKQKYGSFAKVIFFPFDISFVVTRIIKKVRPRIFIAVETEIWPNLYYRLKRRNIPILIINGRISHNAFKRYLRIKRIMKKIFEFCDNVAVQNQDYMNKFMALGCAQEKILIGGNMKFESISCDQERLRHLQQRYAATLKSTIVPLIVAGSTHPGEEEMLLTIQANLTGNAIASTLLIAPRHIERIPSIEKLARDRGFEPVRLSEIVHIKKANQIFLLDTIGELFYFYAIADICFVGGSLSGNGGHNVLEPIYFSKPTLFGPSMENFVDITGAILKHQAAIQVRDPQALEKELVHLLQDPQYRQRISRACSLVFNEEHKSLSVHAQLIERFLRT